LERFDADHRTHDLAEAQGVEIRLGEATLAVAEQRFADALAAIKAQDEARERELTKAATRRAVRVLQVRGHSFYGMQEWQDALSCYRRLLALQPDRLGAMARAADCRYALQQQAEAFSSYDALATSHNQRGIALLARGELDAATGNFEKAVGIQTRLLELTGRSELADELATSHHNLASTLLVLRRSDAAIEHYAKANQLATRLIEHGGLTNLASQLAMTWLNLGDAHFAQGKPDAATTHYQKAGEILDRLSAQTNRSELAHDWARCHLNLGNAFAQGRLADAGEHYEQPSNCRRLPDKNREARRSTTWP
jgi:tetratricopeptide (TPR) repeat protein